MKLAVVLPCNTVIVLGGLATSGRVLERLMTQPPNGAGAVRVAVPVVEMPPGTTVGEIASEVSAGKLVGLRVKTVLTVAPYVPEMVTLVSEATELVLTVNVALVCVAGTVTVAGTVAAPVLLLLNVTTAPPAGAAAPSVTIPVAELVEVTTGGSNTTETRFDVAPVGVTASARYIVAPYVAEMFVVTVDATVGVVIVKFAVLAPAGTVTVEGTVPADVLLLASAIVTPP